MHKLFSSGEDYTHFEVGLVVACTVQLGILGGIAAVAVITAIKVWNSHHA
ncbi:hypothetical protein [Neorhizobium galegae]|nr:hypothetical protein [Neorhizobium galegae]MCQ1856036.1 hypothetical protein [Neorhizobium galegae]